MRLYEIFKPDEDLNSLVIAAYQKLKANPNKENHDEYNRLLKLRNERDNPNPNPIVDTPQEDDYRMSHRAPDHLSGSPLYDLTLNGTYPPDFYSMHGLKYYGDVDNPGIYHLVCNFRNKPNARLVIYRSIPANLEGKIRINIGDWVSLTKQYVVAHGKAEFKGKFKILTKTVSARDVFTSGDSLEEWGYDPQPPVKRKQ